mgnify:FL=1
MSLITISWRLSPLFIIFVAFFLARFNSLMLVDIDVLRALPYLLAVVLFCFAAMFNRSRFIAPVVITLFSYWFIRERLQSPLIQEEVMAMFTGLNLLFCGQLILSSLIPEKGMFNRIGFIFISLLLLGDALLWYYGTSSLWMGLLADLASQHDGLFESRYWVNNALLIVHATTALVLTLVALLRRSVADFALLLTWLSGAIIFYDFSLENISPICFSALFLSLFLVFQQSNYQVTYKDALTGISGRRALEDYLSTLGRHYSIAMLDVDHFKKFNDTYGHDVGDQVLKMVASRIAKVEGGGKAFRYGGEEFTIVFNRRSSNDIFVYLEAVRTSIQDYHLTLRGDDRDGDRKAGKQQRGKSEKAASKSVSVTISIGVADSASRMTPKDVVKTADGLLYKAKETGRNCTIKA